MIPEPITNLLSAWESKSAAWRNGFDSAVHGANTVNCGIGNFRTRELTTEWEQGRAAGEAELERRKMESRR